MELANTRYSRILDDFEGISKKERTEKFENYQFLLRRKREEETLEQFHSVLNGLAAKCNLGTLERRILLEVFIVNMNNKNAQTELGRSKKIPDDVYKTVLWYERGDTYAKTTKLTGG